MTTFSRLLDEVRDYFTTYVAFAYPEQADAITLWVVYTHCFALGQPYSWVPYVLATSAEPMSGKTTLLDLAAKLAYKPLRAESMSPALVGRQAGGRTLFLDEIDGVYKGRPTDNDGAAIDLRSILNGGFNKDGTYQRLEQTKGGSFEPRSWPTFGPKMLAGIGHTVPDTVRSRSIPIRLTRKGPGAEVEKARDRLVSSRAEAIRERIVTIVAAVGELAFIDVMPEGMSARDEDIWEPLIALGDAAGPTWGVTARGAAIKLVEAEPFMSNGMRLLSDIRDLFGDQYFMATKDLIGHVEDSGYGATIPASGLCAVEDFGWSEWSRGRPITPHALAKLLAEYDITSKREAVGHRYGASGYFQRDFTVAWETYLP